MIQSFDLSEKTIALTGGYGHLGKVVAEYFFLKLDNIYEYHHCRIEISFLALKFVEFFVC